MIEVTQLTAYEVVRQQAIPELNSEAVIMRHRKSGARLFLLSNDDVNKVFAIGFRTPPADSTGLPHILEHSVLCGSRKFPAKDPFVELAKGSLNTFLNAMTYPDKTVYPVASCNDQDFRNLMDVYLDAVFYPNIYQNEKIFRQEGWHYELESPEDELTINGVVYNEMKGEFSSPETILDYHTKKALFPDTCYGQESGGDPAVIPELTYEAFLEFHKTYYHPSNSYIYLYGDVDMAERLTWLDEAYLSAFEAVAVDSAIREQAPLAGPVEETVYYPITEEQDEEEESYLSVSMVTGDDLDPELYVALSILEYALLTAPGAPVKQALLDAGIGSDVFGGYESGVLQPTFTVAVKGAGAAKKDAFLAEVDRTLREIAAEGVNPKSLLAGINYYEFKYREADYGSYPKGLMYGLQCFDSWLYDENDPLMHLQYEGTFAAIREKAQTGYFEELIRDYLLGNAHRATVLVLPKKGMQAELDEALAAKLAQVKAGWSEEECAQCVRETAALAAYQEEPTPKEELEKIPLLTREDIDPQVEPITYQEKELCGVKVIHSELFTSDIGYLKVLFDVQGVPEEDLGYLGLLKSILGLVDTEHYGYQDLYNEIYIHSGGLSTGISAFPDVERLGDFAAAYEFSAKVKYEKLEFAFEMIEEMALRSVFRDEKRLKELLEELKSRSQARIAGSGNASALLRSSSYHSQLSYFNDAIGGIAYYKFLEHASAHFDEVKETLIAKCESLVRQLFRRDNMLVSYTADAAGFARLEPCLARFVEKLEKAGEQSTGAEQPFVDKSHSYALTQKNEGFQTSSSVQYVARSGNFRTKGYDYTGALRILKVILSYEYLWQKVRVKGGAYGCSSGFQRTGEGYFVSYRDPNLEATNRTYEGVSDYVAQIVIDERDMTKYIIGTVSDLDAPLSPAGKGSRNLAAYLSGITTALLQKERDEVLTAQEEDIRALAGITAAVLEEGDFCVIGGEQKVKEAAALFQEVKPLFT